MRIILKPFVVSSSFGSVDSAHPDPHTGVDLAMKSGTDILSPVNGIVSQVVDLGNQSLGKAVYVKVKGGNELIFGHLSKATVNVGDPVLVAQKIAESGSTGRSTGPHLHMALKDATGHFIDPGFYVDLFQKVSDAHQPAKDIGQKILEGLNSASDYVIGKEMEFLFAPFVKSFTGSFERLLSLLNDNSAEIVTLGCVGCGIMLMISSVIGGSSKWFGRLFLVFLAGVTWRILI